MYNQRLIDVTPTRQRVNPGKCNGGVHPHGFTPCTFLLNSTGSLYCNSALVRKRLFLPPLILIALKHVALSFVKRLEIWRGLRLDLLGRLGPGVVPKTKAIRVARKVKW